MSRFTFRRRRIFPGVLFSLTLAFGGCIGGPPPIGNPADLTDSTANKGPRRIVDPAFPAGTFNVQPFRASVDSIRADMAYSRLIDFATATLYNVGELEYTTSGAFPDTTNSSFTALLPGCGIRVVSDPLQSIPSPAIRSVSVLMFLDQSSGVDIYDPLLDTLVQNNPIPYGQAGVLLFERLTFKSTTGELMSANGWSPRFRDGPDGVERWIFLGLDSIEQGPFPKLTRYNTLTHEMMHKLTRVTDGLDLGLWFYFANPLGDPGIELIIWNGKDGNTKVTAPRFDFWDRVVPISTPDHGQCNSATASTEFLQ